MRGDYDYNHATMNAQFIALFIAVTVLGGLIVGLTLLTSIL